MYSPKIYEPQIPCLYYAAQASGVSMTKLVNAFVYEGLATGYYGLESANRLPDIDQTLPWLVKQAEPIVSEDPVGIVKPMPEISLNRLYAWYDSLQQAAESYDAEAEK